MEKAKRGKRGDTAKKAGARRNTGTRNEAAAGGAPRPFSARELRGISAQISARWFRAAEPTHLSLLEIDPWRVHAYWNVDDETLASARAALGGEAGDAPLVLRFHDLSPGTAAAPFDIEVQGNRNNWYVELWADAKRYMAELALRLGDGALQVLAHSNEIETPRGGPSAELAFRQSEVRRPRVLELNAPAAPADDDEQLLRELFPGQRPPERDFPQVSAGIPAPADEPRLPAPLDEIGEAGELTSQPLPFAEAPPQTAAAEPSAPATTAGADDFPQIEMSEFAAARRAARTAKSRMLKEIPFALPPVPPETIAPTDLELVGQPLPIPEASATGIPEATARAVEAQETPSATATATAPRDSEAAGEFSPPPAPQPPPPLALEHLLGDSPFSPGRGDDGVELQAELLISGRQYGDRELSLFGTPVPQERDGSFAVRTPLHRGPELSNMLHRLHAERRNEDDG